MFAALGDGTRRAVARLLRARLAVPGEVIVRRGERGDAMYFISSGAVEVRISPQPVQLGSGDFFGELALLVISRRNADVVALGYCQLLSLGARDLDRLFGAEPALRDHIRAIAEARIATAQNPVDFYGPDLSKLNDWRIGAARRLGPSPGRARRNGRWP